MNNELSIITATYNRPEKFKTICLASILSQSQKNFEWVIVNDGADQETRKIIEEIKSPISINYIETPHQGLCKSRNLGLEYASRELVGFLDDDNQIYNNYVEQIIIHFQDNPHIFMAMPIQDRRRDVYREGKLVRKGKEFISPKPEASNEDFVRGRAIFDSNGFVHHQNERIRFNENLLILSDFEYLLQCFSEWGFDSFLLLKQHLVRYIQTSDGIIGQSKWQDWLKDTEYLWKNRSQYKIFSILDPSDWLPQSIAEIKRKIENNEKIPGFSE
ncbi:glycosyltransferase family 2 protein [Nostoc sp. CENA67]|uniref:Glycosyltransferase family 2 protein n=1 Tax=Amazonocrinis nigriterrae CENA67 TaxID=2794033 RepID=A0A8J7LBZ9_9NOST|nr:glycosyltransferase family A protein [Amazonocrinis nigriterrae]MBH8566230.1 glycosyltransferase family 2 protein [Amazonocrinis nigriterrae CENA67]